MTSQLFGSSLTGASLVITGSALVSYGLSVGGTLTFGTSASILTVQAGTLSALGALASTGEISITSGTSSIVFTDSGTVSRGVRGIVGLDDGWYVGGGATASGAGYMEIASGDDSSEPIYFRQYSGAPISGTVSRSLKLLGSSGETYIPGSLTLGDNLFVNGTAWCAQKYLHISYWTMSVSTGTDTKLKTWNVDTNTNFPLTLDATNGNLTNSTGRTLICDIRGEVGWPINATGVRAEWITVNDVQASRYGMQLWNAEQTSTEGTLIPFFTRLTLANGEYISLWVWQTSGSALTHGGGYSGASGTTRMSIVCR